MADGDESSDPKQINSGSFHHSPFGAANSQIHANIEKTIALAPGPLLSMLMGTVVGSVSSTGLPICIGGDKTRSTSKQLGSRTGHGGHDERTIVLSDPLCSGLFATGSWCEFYIEGHLDTEKVRTMSVALTLRISTCAQTVRDRDIKQNGGKAYN